MKYTKKQKRRMFIVASAAFAALAVIVATILIITVNASKRSIKGEWNNREKNVTYVFKKDDMLTAKFDNSPVPVIETDYSGELNGEYLINKKDKTLSITINYYNKKLTQKYSYEIKNKNLALKNLEDGTITVFYKQES